jgi:hypothetical protein
MGKGAGVESVSLMAIAGKTLSFTQSMSESGKKSG